MKTYVEQKKKDIVPVIHEILNNFNSTEGRKGDIYNRTTKLEMNGTIPKVVAIDGKDKLHDLIIFNSERDEYRVIPNAIPRGRLYSVNNGSLLEKYVNTFKAPVARAYMIMLMDYGYLGDTLTDEDKEKLTNKGEFTPYETLIESQSDLKFGKRVNAHVQYFTDLMRERGVLSGNNISELPRILRASPNAMFGNIVVDNHAESLSDYHGDILKFNPQERTVIYEKSIGALSKEGDYIQTTTYITESSIDDGADLVSFVSNVVGEKLVKKDTSSWYANIIVDALEEPLVRGLLLDRQESRALRQNSVAQSTLYSARKLIEQGVVNSAFDSLEQLHSSPEHSLMRTTELSEVLTLTVLLQFVPIIDSVIAYVDAQYHLHSGKLTHVARKLILENTQSVMREEALSTIAKYSNVMQRTGHLAKRYKESFDKDKKEVRGNKYSYRGSVNALRYLAKVSGITRKARKVFSKAVSNTQRRTNGNDTSKQVFTMNVPLSTTKETPLNGYSRPYSSKQYTQALERYNSIMESYTDDEQKPRSLRDTGNYYLAENLTKPHREVALYLKYTRAEKKARERWAKLGNEYIFVGILEEFVSIKLNLKGIKKLGKKVTARFDNKYRMETLLSGVVPSFYFDGGHNLESDAVVNALPFFTETMLKWVEDPANSVLFTSSRGNLSFNAGNYSVTNFLTAIQNTRVMNAGTVITENNVRTILEYIFTDCVIRQHVPDPFSEYADYLTSYQALVDGGYRKWENFELRPTSLRLNHDIITAEDRELSGGISDTVFLNRYRNIRDTKFDQVVHALEYDGELQRFKLLSPTCKDALVAEGKALSHCVGSYGTRIKQGTCLVLFLRKEEDLDTSFLTVEFTIHTTTRGLTYRLGQVQGYGNRERVPMDLKNALRRKVSELNNYVQNADEEGNMEVFKNARKNAKKSVDTLVPA